MRFETKAKIHAWFGRLFLIFFMLWFVSDTIQQGISLFWIWFFPLAWLGGAYLFESHFQENIRTARNMDIDEVFRAL